MYKLYQHQNHHHQFHIRVNIRVDIRVNFENGGKENPEKEKNEKIRPNGVDFLNPEVEKPLTPIFEPNRSIFSGNLKNLIYFVTFSSIF